MRRLSRLELMLLATVVLWALNLTVTRYILTHGFEPLAYATVRYGLATAIFIVIVLVGERTLRIARARPAAGRARGAVDLPQPALVRVRAREDDRVDDRAHSRRDAGVRRRDRARARAGAAVAPLLDRRGDLVRRRRPRRARERRGLRRPPRRPARDRDGGDLGGLLRRGRAADAAVLGVADQRRRSRARLARDPRSSASRRRRTRTSTSAGRSGCCSASRRSARSC